MGLTIPARVVVGTPGCFECTRTGELFVLTSNPCTRGPIPFPFSSPLLVAVACFLCWRRWCASVDIIYLIPSAIRTKTVILQEGKANNNNKNDTGSQLNTNSKL